MPEIEWSDPPARKGAGRPLNKEDLDTAKTLIANPEKWGKIQVASDDKKLSGIAQSIRNGARAAYVAALKEIEVEGGWFDAAVRAVEGEGHALWVRFTTEPKKQPKSKAAAKKTEAKAAEPKAEAKPKAEEPVEHPKDDDVVKAPQAAFSG
jgi:hypothetical protein